LKERPDQPEYAVNIQFLTESKKIANPKIGDFERVKEVLTMSPRGA